jgi:putative flippase GtrA
MGAGMDLTEKKSNKKRLIAEIFRFLLVGGFATVCDYAVYLLFRKLVLPSTLLPGNAVWDSFSAVIATTLGFLAGLLINWVLSVFFVFRDGEKQVDVKSKSDFIKFTVIALIGLFFTQVVVGVGVLVLPPFPLFGTETFLTLGWNEWVLKATTTCIVLVFNYFARKKFIFR